MMTVALAAVRGRHHEIIPTRDAVAIATLHSSSLAATATRTASSRTGLRAKSIQTKILMRALQVRWLAKSPPIMRFDLRCGCGPLIH